MNDARVRINSAGRQKWGWSAADYRLACFTFFALRGLTLAALDCLNLLLGLYFFTFWCVAGFFAACTTPVTPQLKANARANVRNRMPYYCVLAANHKYIFRKLTAVKRMQNQPVARQMVSTAPRVGLPHR